MEKIKNIVFDLGNVLLDLNFSHTEEAFRELLQEDFEEAYLAYEAAQLFERLEIGKISPFEFVNGMRAATEVPLTDDDIIDAWNAILQGISKERLQWLKNLKADYKIYLLSNTNAIHILWLDEYLQDTHQQNLANFLDLFDAHFLSFQLKMRKPDTSIFQHVLSETGIKAAETLFIDDRQDNVATAAGLGFQTYQHAPSKEIIETFSDFIG